MVSKEQIEGFLAGARLSIEEAKGLLAVGFPTTDPGVQKAAQRASAYLTDVNMALVNNRWVRSETALVSEAESLTEHLAALRVPV